MPQIKAQQINWLERAWDVAKLLDELPDTPNPQSLLPRQATLLRLTQDHIALYLTYRIAVHYRYKPDPDSSQRVFYHVEDRDPARIARAYLATGIDFEAADANALFAQAYLARIAVDRYVSRLWKWQLPLMIAGIGGPSAGAIAKKAPNTRTSRQSYLQIQKAKIRRYHPGMTWKEALDHLQGIGIVESWEPEGLIHWIDESGEPRQTKAGTFKNWK